jgi:hypothetical protein
MIKLAPDSSCLLHVLTDQLALALLVSRCLTAMLPFLRTQASLARRRNWRLMLIRCREKLKEWCSGVKRQKRRPRGQPLRWVCWLPAWSCLLEFTVAGAQRKGPFAVQKDSIDSPCEPAGGWLTPGSPCSQLEQLGQLAPPFQHTLAMKGAVELQK